MRDSPIALRPWSDEDLAILHRTLGDPAMMAHLGGIETADQIAVRHQRFLASTGHEGMFVIRFDDASVGTIGYWETSWKGETVYETGWFVLPEFAGRGFASAGASEIVELARTRRWHRFLHAFPDVANAPSNRVCEKAGLTNLGEQTVEYPIGRFMQSNDWRIDISSGRFAVRAWFRRGR